MNQLIFEQAARRVALMYAQGRVWKGALWGCVRCNDVTHGMLCEFCRRFGP